MQYKDGKIIQIIQEFSVLGNTYNLNGIDLDHAVFFVREDRKKFRALLPAEYKIITTGANTDLVIEDGILKYCIAVQVGFDISKISDEYNPTGNPDIVILKDQYLNPLLLFYIPPEVMHGIFFYLLLQRKRH